MATKVEIKGYSQVELNNVAFRRDGRIEAQCKAGAGLDIMENGMLLAVDNVKREVLIPTNAQTKNYPIALVYTAEHMYDERANALKDFALKGQGDFLPRLGYLAIGDKFTTNCLSSASGDYTELVADLDGTPAYGGIDTANGRILVAAEAPAYGPVLKVVKKTTMPNGEPGLQFQVVKA